MSQEFCRDVPDPWRCSKRLCKKTSCAFFVPYTGYPSGGGVLRDCLLRRRWMLNLLGKKRRRQLLRSLFPDPLREEHPVDKDSFFFCVLVRAHTKGVMQPHAS